MVKKFTTAQTIFTGWGALQESGTAVSELGEKPLVVTSAGTWKRMGTQLNELLSKCFSAYAVCDCINTEPTDTMIAEGLEVYQKNGCDCLIGIGGGSPLDAIHAIEAYTSKQAQPLTDALAISAAKCVFRYLPLAYQDGKNREAREEMAAAALEAGICINNSSVTIVHGMSRPIGALFHVPHGLSNAMLLEKCLQFALPGCYERFGLLGRAIGAASADSTDSEAADALLQAVKLLCYTCEVPTLEQYGIAKTTFFNAVEKMAADAIASGSPGNTRREVTAEDCAAIYYSLWEN